jgi:hypothetical protein
MAYVRQQQTDRANNSVISYNLVGCSKSLTFNSELLFPLPPHTGDYNFGASTHALTLRGQTAITGELALITS